MAALEQSDQLRRSLEQLGASIPRFLPSIQPKTESEFDPALGQPGILDLGTLANAPTLRRAVEYGSQCFQIEKAKHCAHLWLYSLLGDFAAPAANIMVRYQVFPLLDADSGILFCRESGGYWFGFQPHQTANDAVMVGQSLARTMSPIIESLCATFDMRPAPLWALVTDGIVQPLLGAGNDDFEQLLAIDMATQAVDGIQQVCGIAPQSRFAVIEDGQVFDYEDNGDDPEFVFAHRSSCCMIYHSPQAGMCTSCPHQGREERLAKLVEVAQSQGF